MTWLYHVDVSDVFHDEALSLHERAVEIAKRIRASMWYTMAGDDSWLEELLQELESSEDAYEFDYVWDAIYDEADKDRAWIETWGRIDHQNERKSGS